MAKKSMKARDQKRIRLEQQVRAKRQTLKDQAQKAYAEGEIPWDVQRALQKLPRNSHHTRICYRCRICGRSRAVYKKFGLCRLCLRKLDMSGLIPGLSKASW